MRISNIDGRISNRELQSDIYNYVNNKRTTLAFASQDPMALTGNAFYRATLC